MNSLDDDVTLNESAKTKKDVDLKLCSVNDDPTL